MWTQPPTDVINTKETRKISSETFEVLKTQCHDVENDLKIKKKVFARTDEDINLIMNKSGRFHISVVEFNTMLMEKLDILGEIQRLIFSHGDEEKFLYNEYTKKTQISPIWMNKTNQFNALK